MGQGGTEGGAAPSDRLLAVIRELHEELSPRAAEVRLNSAFERDLGLDSLALVELLARVEDAFGVTLPDEVLAEAETPRDLLTFLAVSEESLDTAAARPDPAPVTPGAAAGSQVRPPEDAGTWLDVLRWHAGGRPDGVHLRLIDGSEGPRVLTYGAAVEQAEQVALGLRNRGVDPGDRIALMLPTGLDYFSSFLGVLLAGGVPVPIYPPWRKAQLKDHLMRQAGILLNAGAGTLITVPEARLLAQQLRLRVPSLRHVLTPAQVAGKADGPWQDPPVASTDIALLQYTSGSTGSPKGVVLTHANLLANVRAMGSIIEVKGDDVFVSWLPLYHDMGLIGAWLGSLYYGIPLVVMPPAAFLRRPLQWLKTIQDHRGTISAAPNFGYELCLNRIPDQDLKALDLSSWRLAFNGAEPVSPGTVERFSERFAACGFLPEAMAPVYGLAESSLGVTFPPLGRRPVIDSIAREPFLSSGRADESGGGDDLALRFVGCGSPLPGHALRIVGERGDRLGDRQQGRIQFSGPSATGGYFRNPEATRQLIRDGWLDSGDLGYLANGELFVTGRAKDMIIRLGRNIHPQELEQAVGEVRGIRKGRTAVFGATDPRSGTEKLVILTETREKDEGKRQQMHEAIVAAAVDLAGTPPDDVVLARPGTVLKTSSGKIRRADCRSLYERGELGARTQPVWVQVADLFLRGARSRVERLPRKLARAAFALYAWIVLAVLGTITWTAVAILPGVQLRWVVFRTAARLILRMTGMGPEVRRAGRPVEPAVVVANHASMLDGLALSAVLPQQLVFVAAGEFARHRVAGTFLRRLGTVFVDRANRSRAAGVSDELKDIGRSGATIVIFPEGRMSRMPGLQPFRLGAFRVAADAGVPVLPVTIVGTEKILRGDRRVPRPGVIEVFLGDPIEPQEAGWAGAVNLRTRARAAVLKHFREPDLE